MALVEGALQQLPVPQRDKELSKKDVARLFTVVRERGQQAMDMS